MKENTVKENKILKKTNLSQTAQLIAESICFLAANRKFKFLVPNDSAELSYLFSQKRIHPINQTKLIRALRNNLLNRAIPGITLHYLLRKKRIEEFVRCAIGDGFRQIIILGAGFDTLGFRLGAEFSDVEFIEIDHFESQLQKIRTLNKHALSFPNLSFFAGDLDKQTLGEILNSALFNPQKKTFFIAEGLLMYLSEAKVRRLFSSINEVCRDETRFAFTFMNKRSDGKIRFKNSSNFVDFWLDLHGEPFKWGISETNLPLFLVDLGHDLIALETDQNFRESYLNTSDLQNEMLAQGEFLCLVQAGKTDA